jgi:hypothetical protein
MMNTVANLTSARKKKTNRRVFQALECMYAEALRYLADSNGNIDPADWEAFLIQVLGEYLTNTPTPQFSQTTAVPQVLANYQRFDNSLRHCLHQKLRSLHHFERIRVRT